MTTKRRIRVAEFFAGSRSIGREAERMNMDVFSVDNNPKFKGINLVADMEFVTPDQLPWEPDIIWASPPCTTYSMLAIGHHRNEDGTPKTEFAFKSDRLVQHTIDLFKAFPNAIWYMENPCASLRVMPFMKQIPEPVTIWYCRYGDKRAKPTDIWTNNLFADTLFGFENVDGWKPRPECWNGNKSCHHESAPRSSKTGTQGLKNDYERSKVPAALCREVLLASVDIIARPRS